MVEMRHSYLFAGILSAVLLAGCGGNTQQAVEKEAMPTGWAEAEGYNRFQL